MTFNISPYYLTLYHHQFLQLQQYQKKKKKAAKSKAKKKTEVVAGGGEDLSASVGAADVSKEPLDASLNASVEEEDRTKDPVTAHSLPADYIKDQEQDMPVSIFDFFFFLLFC